MLGLKCPLYYINQPGYKKPGANKFVHKPFFIIELTALNISTYHQSEKSEKYVLILFEQKNWFHLFFPHTFEKMFINC